MIRLFIDGDACPVKDEAVKVASRYALQVFIVSNRGLRAALGTNVQGIMVGPEFDAADNWIEAHIEPGDIAITSDIQLAARCLKKHASALGPTGALFTADNIGSSLAMRDLNAYLREAGAIKSHNPPFAKKDRSNFLQALDTLIQKQRRG